MSIPVTHACLVSIPLEDLTPLCINRELKVQLWLQNNGEILPVFLDNVVNCLDIDKFPMTEARS